MVNSDAANPWGIPSLQAPGAPSGVRPRSSGPAGWMGGGRGAPRMANPTPEPTPDPNNPWAIGVSPSQSPNRPVSRFTRPPAVSRSPQPQIFRSDLPSQDTKLQESNGPVRNFQELVRPISQPNMPNGVMNPPYRMMGRGNPRLPGSGPAGLGLRQSTPQSTIPSAVSANPDPAQSNSQEQTSLPLPKELPAMLGMNRLPLGYGRGVKPAESGVTKPVSFLSAGMN